MADVLSEICALKREHITKCKRAKPENQVLREAEQADATRGFTNALSAKVKAGSVGLIAEIKKASPSKGVIREDFSPAMLAEAYAEGGATCLSVLTDEPYFQGADAYLQEARAVCALPVLRKDFMLDPYQIIEARALGADCILLIMACVSDGQAEELFAAAKSLGMDALIEVHDTKELDRALNRLPAQLVGINNRNLKTLEIDLSTSEMLAKIIPDSIVKVCESGISTPADIARMRKSGLHCFLVGESLMREKDVLSATKTLLSL